MASTTSQESILQVQETPVLSYTPPSSSSLYPHPRIPLSDSDNGIMPVSSLPLSARSTSTTTEQTAVNVNYNDEGRRTPSGASTTVISHCGDDDGDENLAKLEKINNGYCHRQGDGEFSTSRDQQLGGLMTITPAAPLTEEQRRLAIMYRNAADKRSAVPIFYFLAASLGKL